MLKENITIYSDDTCKSLSCLNNDLPALNFGDNEATIPYTDNNISVAVTSNEYLGEDKLSLSGTLDARFYGGMNEELGGTFMLTNASTESYYYGVFGAKAEDLFDKNDLTGLNASNLADKVDNLLAIPHSVGLAKITADSTISINKFTDAVIVFDYDEDGNFVSDEGLQLYFTDKKYEVMTGIGTDNTTITNDSTATNNGTTSNDADAPISLMFSRADSYFGVAAQYMALVHWQVNDDDGAGNTTYHSYAYGITGFETIDAAIPNPITDTGAVNFGGKGGGFYSGATDYATQFTATASVNFYTKNVTISSSSTMKCGDNSSDFASCTPESATDMLDFTTATISYTDNNISGNVALTNDTTFGGTIDARFYGPNAEELGGTFSMQSSDNSAGYIGFFGVKQ